MKADRSHRLQRFSPHQQTVFLWVFAFALAIPLLLLAAFGKPGVWKPSSVAYDAQAEQAATSLVEQTVRRYSDDISDLRANLGFQLVLVILSIILVTHPSTEIEVPLLGTKVQTRWLHVIVPVALFYMWLKFGFLLDTLIKERALGWELIRNLGSPQSTLVGFVRAQLYCDSSFCDAWFYCFRVDHALADTSAGIVPILNATFHGGFFGLTHACAISVAALGFERFSADRSVKLLCFLSVVGGILVLLISHLLFAYGGQNRNWLQLTIAVWTVVFTFALLRTAFNPDELPAGPSGPAPEPASEQGS